MDNGNPLSPSQYLTSNTGEMCSYSVQSAHLVCAGVQPPALPSSAVTHLLPTGYSCRAPICVRCRAFGSLKTIMVDNICHVPLIDPSPQVLSVLLPAGWKVTYPSVFGSSGRISPLSFCRFILKWQQQPVNQQTVLSSLLLDDI